MTIKPLDIEDHDLWHQLDPPDTESRPLSEPSTEEATDPRSHLIALDGDRCIGRLRGTFINGHVYRIDEVRGRGGEWDEEIAKELVAYLAPGFAADGINILSWEKPASEASNRVIASSGFVLHRRKVFVDRKLDGYTSPYRDPFTYRSLVDAGEEEFVRVMAVAAIGDPFEDVSERDPFSDFRDLVTYAGDAFDPEQWVIASLNGVEVGVVLPQIYADRREQGTLFYIGVVPAFRGRGYGRILHAHGLAVLARLGIVRYTGSTDDRNAGMIKIFEANDCTQRPAQLLFRAVGL